MIKGFNNETAPLNEYEKNVLLPIITLGLSQKVGKHSAVTNRHICNMLKKQGYELNQARVRKIINHIRINSMVIGLIATYNGYYIAENRKEMSDYLDSLKSRENAIKAVRVAIENQMYSMY